MGVELDWSPVLICKDKERHVLVLQGQWFNWTQLFHWIIVQWSFLYLCFDWSEVMFVSCTYGHMHAACMMVVSCTFTRACYVVFYVYMDLNLNFHGKWVRGQRYIRTDQKPSKNYSWQLIISISRENERVVWFFF